MSADSAERRRSAEQFRIAIEAAPTGMLMVDRAGRIALVNAHMEKIFGYSREELLNEPVEMLVPERFRGGHPGHRRDFFDTPDARPMGRGRDLYGLRKNGTEVPIEIGLTPLRTPEGEFVLSSVADITERRRAEHEKAVLLEQIHELTDALKEREILLQEVHHRVKNNLQVISSLLNMQARRLDEGTTRDAVEKCQTRVQAIALIHEKLHQSKDHARVPFSDYARSLANNVFQAIDVSPSTVTLELAIDDLALGVDRATRCGLVLNELITNALKHGFKNGRSGTIRVELAAVDGGRLRLAVHDNGIGLSKGLDIHKSDSLGFQLVRTIAEQLDAMLEVDSEAGASVRLTFPAEA